jgi:4-aminobutyrate--pyruvate transaminase
MNNRKQDYIKLDLDHLVHGFTDLAQWRRTGSPMIIARGSGVMLEDIDGNRYLDGCVPATVNTLGHGRSDIAAVAAAQMQTLEFFDLIGGAVHPAVLELCERLSRVSGSLQHFFFINSGSEANDTAISIARRYWVSRGKPEKTKIISRIPSNHGLTMTMRSVSGIELWWKGWGPGWEDVIHIPSPHPYRSPFGDGDASTGAAAAKALSDAIERVGAENVAAFIADPVPNSQGCIVPPYDYFPLVRKICSDRGILFIADEVLTGFGRTGKMWGLQNWGVEPDMMTLGKGITSGYVPMAAVAMSDDVFDVLATPPNSFFSHYISWTGHPVAAAVAAKCLDILREEKIVEHVAHLGKHIASRLQAFADMPAVGNVRGIGVMAAIELVADRKTKAAFPADRNPIPGILDELKRQGVLISSRGNSLYMCPPLVAKIEDIDTIFDRLTPLVAAVKPLAKAS